MARERLFLLLSWGVTILLVAGLLGFTFFRLQGGDMTALLPPTTTPETVVETRVAPTTLPAQSSLDEGVEFAISRKLTLKTTIPERPNYGVKQYTVKRGDSIRGISTLFNIEPETLLWANYDVLEDDPHGLQPGQELRIPPTNGLLYEWKEGDKLEEVVGKYETKMEDVLYWPGNNLEVSNPRIKPGQMVMLPGGWRQTNSPAVAVSVPVGATCSGGGTGSFGFPGGTGGVSGNDFYPGHPGVDFSGSDGDPVYASDGGLVVKAEGGWNGGYGNVVFIDHCNGYVTVYAHLSAINVSAGMTVGRGTVVGAVGNTGNSFGSHLHFEVRLNGTPINPWSVFQ